MMCLLSQEETLHAYRLKVLQRALASNYLKRGKMTGCFMSKRGIDRREEMIHRFVHPNLVMRGIETVILWRAVTKQKPVTERVRHEHLLELWFKGDGASNKSGWRFQAPKYLKAALRQWSREWRAILYRHVSRKALIPNPPLNMNNGSFELLVDQVTFFRHSKCLMNHALSAEAANVIKRLAELFVEANTSEEAEFKGDGSLTKRQTAYMVQRMMGPAYIKGVKLETFIDRLEPVFNYAAENEDGIFILTFHGVAKVLLTSPLFNLSLAENTRQELTTIFRMEQLQLKGCKLRRPSRVNAEHLETYGDFRPTNLGEDVIQNSLAEKEYAAMLRLKSALVNKERTEMAASRVQVEIQRKMEAKGLTEVVKVAPPEPGSRPAARRVNGEAFAVTRRAPANAMPCF